MLRCKRRSQLARDRTPVRPHVLHTLPWRYAEGDVNTIADGSCPPAGDALGTAKQTTGQHQGRCLVHAEPYLSMNFTRPITELKVELTRFRGYLILLGGGIHHATNTSRIPA